MHLKFHRYWARPLLEPFQQNKLEFQDEDSKKSVKCPIYTNACRRSIYLCSSGEVKLHWHGGHSLEVTTPEWWQHVYEAERSDYLRNRAKPENSRRARFHNNSPFADEVGGRSLHRGGMMLNWFTGLSLETPPGYKVLVTRATNHYDPNWTVQDGIYDSDTFPGDFSINIQLLTQNPVTLRLGYPVASLWVINTEETTFDLTQKRVLSDPQRVKSDAWYNEKASGCPYHGHSGKLT